MPSAGSDDDSSPSPIAIKILIAGGFGAGKTTLVASISEIRPLRTEESLSEPSLLVDDLAGVEQKSTTTVAMDFGRITIRDDLVVYLFGTPGQHRFWFMWDELALGALGAVVMADTRRLADSFPSIDYFERAQDALRRRGELLSTAHSEFQSEMVRAALDLDPDVPIVLCDARQRASSRDVLVTLVEYAIRQLTEAGALNAG